MSPFAGLQIEWPEVHDAAHRAETLVHSDPRASCFYSRRALERAVAWLYQYDSGLKMPYQDNISALIHEPTFKTLVGEALFTKARAVIKLGNSAVHDTRPITTDDAIASVRELFHFAHWLCRTYSRRPDDSGPMVFDPRDLPKVEAAPHQTLDQLQKLEVMLKAKDAELASARAAHLATDEELRRVRAEYEALKKAAEARPDDHDYNEAQTRDLYIDLLLQEAGWPLDQSRDREFEVTGMPNQKGLGYVDYVLWGDDGKPLGLVEAKRTHRDPKVGRQQAKLYADCLEAMFDQRPVVFYSNGYEHWFWDDLRSPPRQVLGFYKKDELEYLIRGRTGRASLATVSLNEEIAGRPYQVRAIRRVAEAFEKDNERRALLVMATGAGKTRTVIGLSDLLMRAHWVKRVLFLADRTALVNQADGAFKKHLPNSAPVNLVTEKDAPGRVFLSTYPTMMGLIDETRNGQRRFGPGHFDLIVIDEAHRSVFQKYRSIFDYFDGLLVGLTATPKDELDRNTYSLFNLENGVPTDAYPLEEAVNDGYLVPLKAVSVPLGFQRDGITYDDLSDEEKEQWDELDWDEGEGVPERVEASAVNTWLFNKDTVDKVLEYLMTKGQKVAGGDRLGKTIVFAKNQAHAEFISERFDANYPIYRGEFARVITFKTEYAQTLIDDFSVKDKAPYLAISVDLLDTGIDVPEVVNLVFFKMVRSKTKFWQMVGRGTRLCPDLFGPGQDKTHFLIFDFCQNLEFFGQNPQTIEGTVSEGLSTQLFRGRLEVVSALDKQRSAMKDPDGIDEPQIGYSEPTTDKDVRRETANLLHRIVASMNPDNFLVRAKRRLVEKYAERAAWDQIQSQDLVEISENLAGLPDGMPLEQEEAKRFDLLILRTQLTVLKAEPGFERLRDQIRSIAEALEEKKNIPMVASHLELILDIQQEEWWLDVSQAVLERLRRRLRDLVQFIDKRARKIVDTDFEDTLGNDTEIELPGVGIGTDFQKFRAKARAFLMAHQKESAVHKLRMNEPLTRADLAALERVLLDSEVGTPADLEAARIQADGLGLFVRHLIGLDRGAAKQAFGTFLEGKTWTANQIEFLDMLVNHLVSEGIVEPTRLYESPFVDLAPQGPEGIFTGAQVDQLIAILRAVKDSARAA